MHHCTSGIALRGGLAARFAKSQDFAGSRGWSWGIHQGILCSVPHRRATMRLCGGPGCGDAACEHLQKREFACQTWRSNLWRRTDRIGRTSSGSPTSYISICRSKPGCCLDGYTLHSFSVAASSCKANCLRIVKDRIRRSRRVFSPCAGYYVRSRVVYIHGVRPVSGSRMQNL